jgi:hypothetical protein
MMICISGLSFGSECLDQGSSELSDKIAVVSSVIQPTADTDPCSFYIGQGSNSRTKIVKALKGIKYNPVPNIHEARYEVISGPADSSTQWVKIIDLKAKKLVFHASNNDPNYYNMRPVLNEIKGRFKICN